jgi:hypothetical protein
VSDDQYPRGGSLIKLYRLFDKSSSKLIEAYSVESNLTIVSYKVYYDRKNGNSNIDTLIVRIIPIYNIVKRPPTQDE